MGFLKVVSNAELEQNRIADIEAARMARENESVISSLASEIQRQWQINKDHKRSVEEVMLQCLRQRNGEYSPTELAEIKDQGGSEVYMMLTASQVRSATSWITDILLPGGEKAWGVEPTPVPDLPPDIQEAVVSLLSDEILEARQVGVEPSQEEIETRVLEFKRRMLEALQEEADKAASSMEKRIEDQFAESGFEDAMEAFIDDFSTFPAAILKGPVYQRRKALRWGKDGKPEVYEEIAETDLRVSPFDIYPSPGAVCIEDGRLIERVRYSRKDLSDLIGVPGYNDEAIREVLADEQDGYLGDWTNQRSGEREFLEGNSSPFEEDGLIDGLVYWGDASGQDLLDWGMHAEQVPDPVQQYSIEAILIGRHVIRAQMNGDLLGRRPYYKASYQNKPGSFWGISPPMLMKDVAAICNGTARALMNNMGMASGPMGWVNVDMLPQGEQITSFHPWKLFQVTSKVGGQGGDPVKFFQPNSNAAELMEVYNQFEAKAERATGIPRQPFGDRGLPSGQLPAQTLAMILEMISKDIKGAIKNIDRGVIRPRVERQYHNNMLYLDDPTIKGDLKVVPRGSSALIAKAGTQVRRNEFMAITNNPTDAQIMGIEGRAKLLRQAASDLDLGNIIPDEEVLQSQQAALQQQGAPADPLLEREKLRLDFEAQKLQMQIQDNERERQIKQLLAEYGLKGDMMELAGRKEISLEQIKARLGETAMRERGNNDRFAAEKQIKAQYGSGL